MPYIPSSSNQLVEQMLQLSQVMSKRRQDQVRSQLELLQPGQSLGDANIDLRGIRRVLGLKDATADTVLKPKTAASIADEGARLNEPTLLATAGTRAQTASINAGTEQQVATTIRDNVLAAKVAWDAAPPEARRGRAQRIAGVVAGTNEGTTEDVEAGMAKATAEAAQSKVMTAAATEAFRQISLGTKSDLDKQLRRVGTDLASALTASSLGITGLLDNVTQLSMRTQSSQAEANTAMKQAIAAQATRIAAAMGDRVPVDLIRRALEGRMGFGPRQSNYVEELIDQATAISWSVVLQKGIEEGDPHTKATVQLLGAIGVAKDDESATQVNMLVRQSMARQQTIRAAGQEPPKQVRGPHSTVVDNPAWAHWNETYRNFLSLIPPPNKTGFFKAVGQRLFGSEPVSALGQGGAGQVPAAVAGPQGGGPLGARPQTAPTSNMGGVMQPLTPGAPSAEDTQAQADLETTRRLLQQLLQTAP